jgi:hypothetical protein
MKHMNCLETRQLIRDTIHLGDPRPGDLQQIDAIVCHVKHCELCRTLYDDAVLGRALRKMTIPEPREDFAARAIGNAVRKNRMRRIVSFVGISAAAMLIIITGTVFMRNLPDPSITTVLSEKTVRVMIEVAEPRPNAIFVLDLAENINLKNHPDRAQVVWETDLPKGKNLLELPLVLKDGSDGYVNLRYRYNNKEQEVLIKVRANSDTVPGNPITS